MTTNFSTIKLALSKFCCRGVSHEKQRFGRFSCLPPRRPPSKSENFIFIVVSPSLNWGGEGLFGSLELRHGYDSKKSIL